MNAKRRKMLIIKFIVFVTLWKVQVTAQTNLFKRCFFTEPRCPNKDITFFLYTRDHQNDPVQLDISAPETIINAKFIRNRPLVLLIHGFTGHKDFSPNKQIRPAYFQKDEFNIISIDYKNLAMDYCYITAVNNLPTVANCTAQLLDFLIDENIFSLDAIHVIGFSLGAQTAGMVANYLKDGRKLRRITGLDPAKPLFIRVGNDGRLDSSDAEFVDIIHTDVFVRGILAPVGHVDFYANGGFEQPGCYQQTTMSPGSCNHDRAPEYYAESIQSDIGFWGFRCAHWYLYALGFCKEEESDSVVEMGFNASHKSRGLYFLTTNRNSPFARGKNFTTNTVLPTEPVGAEDIEAVGQAENTL